MIEVYKILTNRYDTDEQLNDDDLHHSLKGSSVLTATFNSYGDRQISTPHKINTPEPIDKKFSIVDYVREGTPYTKFGTNPPTEGYWANG